MKKLISTKMKVFMSFLLITSITCFTSSMVVLYNSDFKLSDYTNWDFYWNNNTTSNYNNLTEIILDEHLGDVQNLNLDFNSNLNGFDAIFQVHSGSNLIINASTNYSSNSSENLLTVANTDGSLNISSTNITEAVLIKIPSSYAKNLSINFRVGSLDLSGVNLETLAITSVSSDLNLINTTCNSANISTTDGNITLNNITSKDLSVDTINGEIYSTTLKGNINLKTISGNIFADLSNEVTNGNFNSTNGDISLSLANDNNFTVDYTTIDGEFDQSSASSLSTTGNYNITSNNRNSKIVMGTGAVPISITTINGDLSF